MQQEEHNLTMDSNLCRRAIDSARATLNGDREALESGV